MGASLYSSASVDVAHTLCPVTLQERVKERIPHSDPDSGSRIYFYREQHCMVTPSKTLLRSSTIASTSMSKTSML